MRDAAADLADARLPVGDAGVDRRREARRGDLARVDAEDRVAAVGELDVRRRTPAAIARHSASMRSTSAGSTPTDGTESGEAAIGERAEAVGLDDRGVAEVRVHVRGRVAVEELRRVGQRGGPDEPAVAESGDADADLDAVAGDRGEHRRARHVRGAVQRELGEDHRQVQEELAVAGDERADLAGARCRAPRGSARCPCSVRWCASSPSASERTCRSKRSSGPRADSAALSSGASTSRIHFRRSSTSGPSAP